MKHLRFLAVCLIAFACQRKEDETFVTNVSHKVEVVYGDAYNGIPAPEAKVRFINQQTGSVLEVTSNANGEVFGTLEAGSYRIEASKELSETEMEILSGVYQKGVFNGNAQVTINAQNNTPTRITLVAGRVGGIVIKQIYYSGSDTKKGAVYRDHFFEVHNNSDEDLPLAGLCLGRVQSVKAGSAETANGRLANGKYDWSKAFGNEALGDKANTDYVYCNEVICFPQGSPMIKKGESIIVAGTAVNHKSPLTVGGKTFSVQDPDLTIDLSAAKYETYYNDWIQQNNTKPSFEASEVDVPTATNMDILYKTYGNKDLIFDAHGRLSLVLFYATKAEIDSYNQFPLPTIKPENATTAAKHLQVPVSKILDGVNLQAEGANKHALGLNETIDGGFTMVTKGIYSSQSVSRKFVEINGRKVYKDTNNSTNDFEVLDRPNTESLN